MAAAKAGGCDGIESLPDEVMQHVLSFLPVADAVRICVLARRWRGLWKSIPVLRVTSEGSVTWLNKFVNNLLLLRDHSVPLNACEIQVSTFKEKYEKPHISIWIRHALLCQARILSVRLGRPYYFLELEYLPLNSCHLESLELCNIQLNDRILNFSSCPALQELWMKDCSIMGDTIMSQSLTRLTILNCSFCHDERARISVPSLVALELSECWGMTPLLESMPSLVTGSIKLAECEDYCVEEDGGSCGSCGNCGANDDGGGDCVTLKGLSEAKSLELIAKPWVYIFKRDLTWCPTFSNLETLLLNEWCMKDNLGALLCLLQHTPVLEKLTIQLCQAPSWPMATEGSNIPTGQPFASLTLKVLELKCEKMDERVQKILRTLRAYGVHIEQIDIQQSNGSSEGSGPSQAWNWRFLPSQNAQLRSMVEDVLSVVKNWIVSVLRPGHNH
ncbi:unnamed protein product [Alopecurus aequalis]